MNNGQAIGRNGLLATTARLHFDDETAAYERKVSKQTISPRTKWYDITKQLVASSRDNSPNHKHDYQWKTFNGAPVNGDVRHMNNGNNKCGKNSIVSDDSECQTTKLTNSSQCSIVVTETNCAPQVHHVNHHSSRADALIEAKTCSFEDSVPIPACNFDEASDKLSVVNETCNRLIPHIENSILVDVSHLTDCSSSVRAPISDSITPEHVFVPIETDNPCISYKLPANYNHGWTQETSFTEPTNERCLHHHHKHHHHHKPYKTRSRKLKVEKQLELTSRRKKRKRHARHRLWSSGDGTSNGAERIENERRRRQNHKMVHRRRASSVSVQKTRNVTKSMVCLKLI